MYSRECILRPVEAKTPRRMHTGGPKERAITSLKVDKKQENSVLDSFETSVESFGARVGVIDLH